MNSLSRIKRLLESETGLDAGTLGSHALETSVGQRTSDLPCGDQEAYWDLLNQDRSELDRLIDEIVVAESWFFRDGGPFEFLGEYVREHVREWIESLLAILHGLLQDDGVLVVGHAEAAPSLLAGRFRPSGQPGAFAFFKDCRVSSSGEEGSGRLSSAKSGSKSATRGRDPRVSKDIGLRPRPSVSGPARNATRPESPPNEPEESPGLDHARRLADAGRLAEAEQVCCEHLRNHAEDSEAYYLLGAVQLAEGHKAEAEESFRKVVYLDRDHVEALWHLATLSESKGDERGARSWRRRLERLAAGGDSDR